MSERLGSQDRFDFSTAEHLTMPRTGVFYSVRTGKDHVGASAEPGLTGKPLETRLARVVKQGGLITVAEPGSGDGFIVFAPDDLNEFCLRGDGVHPEGKWPTKIAMNTFVIMNSKAANGGDDVRNRFAVGTPSARTRGVVVRGVDIDLDFSSDADNPTTVFTSRDEDGAQGTGGFDFVGGTLKSNGVAVGLGNGDVTAAANLTNNLPVVGDGGAKGVKTGTVQTLALGGTPVLGPIPQWFAITITTADFTAASDSESITAFVLPAYGVIHKAGFRDASYIVDGSENSVVLQLGVSGSAKYSGGTTFDWFNDDHHFYGDAGDSMEGSSATNIEVSAQADVNLNTLTSSTVTLMVLLSKVI